MVQHADHVEARIRDALAEDRQVNHLGIESMSIPNSQLPTPRGAARTGGVEFGRTSLRARLPPRWFEWLPWELGVGGWELINRLPRPRSFRNARRAARCALRPTGTAGRAPRARPRPARGSAASR